ncbi:MAG: hypothetical protein WAU47_03965, partial [Desulfobaccales bacterium]
LYDEDKINKAKIAEISSILKQTSYLADAISHEYNDDYKKSLYHPEFSRIEKLYRELKINYERQEDYKNAGDFHYGEMEMHRRANPNQIWYHFYWGLSGYGERPFRALVCLMALFPGLALLIWNFGITYANSIAPASFLDTLLFILEKSTFQRPTWLNPQEFWSILFINLSVLLIPGQAALFILALRNRLGRRR